VDVRFVEVFSVSLRMGLTAFGGPVAHLGYFRDEYVEKRKWVSDERYAELMAVTQFLPGPGSSQLGAAIGYERGGWSGAVAAWLGFTMPSALLMIGFAVGIGFLGGAEDAGWIRGLTLAALAVVMNALLGMRQKLCNTVTKLTFAVVACGVLITAATQLSTPLAWIQPVVIAAGAVLGAFVFRSTVTEGDGVGGSQGRAFKGGKLLRSGLLVALTLSIPFFLVGSQDAQITGGVYRAGALVFGGGHVVLPLLETETVARGVMEQEMFLAGYGAAQALPGPLFTLGAFLGAKLELFGSPWIGGMVALIAVFLPGMLLLTAAVPLWDGLKTKAWARAGIVGANTTVVGVLAAAVAGMLMSGVVERHLEAAAVLVIFCLLRFKVLPVWSLVILSAVGGGLIY